LTPNEVYIITNATSPAKLSLAKILHALHATIYLQAPTLQTINTTISTIKSSAPNSKGHLNPFVADLADPSTIKPAVQSFLAAEYRLDVLFLDPTPSAPSTSATGPSHGSKAPALSHSGSTTHLLSSFLLASSLHPTMANLASHFCHPNPSVRTIWFVPIPPFPSPLAGGTPSPAPEAVQPSQLDADVSSILQSPSLSIHLLAREFSARGKQDKPTGSKTTSATAPNERPHGNPFGVANVVLEPGFSGAVADGAGVRRRIRALIPGCSCKEDQYAQYTALYAGLAPDVRDGDIVVPWGRKGEVPRAVRELVKGERIADGDSIGGRFYAWCEEAVSGYL
jgi:NAD(P)-dependent dehydrogenase (short-subunit alcohol dehydrogenase family)